jgi:hypothetical protein
MNQEGRNSGTCSHAAARRVLVVIINDAVDLFGVQCRTSSFETLTFEHRQAKKEKRL